MSTSPTQMLSHEIEQQNESFWQTFCTQPTPSHPLLRYVPVAHGRCEQFPFGGALQHFPFVHVEVQTVPHMPQLFLSVCVLVHLLLHATSPVPQQVPARHRLPLQSVPHMPQFVLSFWRSKQPYGTHAVLGAPHAMSHAPFVHFHVPPPRSAPPSAPHASPHCPQFFESDFVSTHWLPQIAWLAPPSAAAH